VVTALVISFVYRARPETLENVLRVKPPGKLPLRSLLATLLAAAALTGGVLSWFASDDPDGLEWSIARITESAESPNAQDREDEVLETIQGKTARLPGFAMPEDKKGPAEETASPGAERIGKSLSGLIGGAITLALCFLVGILCRKRAEPKGIGASR
jgi:cobalt/nickel transport system permease protein